LPYYYKNVGDVDVEAIWVVAPPIIWRIQSKIVLECIWFCVLIVYNKFKGKNINEK
jgi:hypothetical protein